MAGAPLLTLDNPVFALYVLSSTILLVKVLLMAFLTGRQRIQHKSFSSPEDLRFAGLKDMKPLHPDVVRVKSCHLNDMENIFPFVFIGLFYVTINPSVTMAKILFSTYTGFRILYTVVYLNEIPQPARALSYMGAMVIKIIMAITVITHVAPLFLLT